MKLQALSLSQEVFNAYDDVIEAQKRDLFHTNGELVERYHDSALAGILEQGRMLTGIGHTQPANLPLAVHKLEHHLLGTQAFIPMKGEVSVVVMALGDDKPDLSTLRALITNSERGVNHHRNVWHHPPFAQQCVTDFLTVDRGSNDNRNVESIPERGPCFA